MLASILACFALLGASLLAWQWIAGTLFPLDQRRTAAPTPPGSIPPTVSILKPVTGADPGTAEALATWFAQDYPGPTEVLLGVSSRDDPAFALVEGLLNRFPRAHARLVVCPPGPAPNRKVATLIRLARESSGQIVVVSDADVSAPPDLLAQTVLGLDEPGTGLVHCLYRLADAPTPAARWEAFVVNADFWSQVLQNRTFKPLDYALGAVMVLRRHDLTAIGGFEALDGYLADDNRLGRLIVRHGLRTHLCPIVVDCRAAPAGWAAVWNHQLRWAVTIRVCQPIPYFLSILANGTLWPLLWAASNPSPPILAGAAGLLAFRGIQALSLESRFTGKPRDWARAWVVPGKDLLQVALWAAAFLRNQVVWRGTRYRVDREGRLHLVDAPLPRPSPGPAPTLPDTAGRSGFGIHHGNR